MQIIGSINERAQQLKKKLNTNDQKPTKQQNSSKQLKDDLDVDQIDLDKVDMDQTIVIGELETDDLEDYDINSSAEKLKNLSDQEDKDSDMIKIHK